MYPKFYKCAEQALRETTADGFSDDVIRPEGFTASVSKAFVEKYTSLVVQDMMVHLAAHALSYSTAMDVYVQWTELYEGKIPEKQPLVPDPGFTNMDF